MTPFCVIYRPNTYIGDTRGRIAILLEARDSST